MWISRRNLIVALASFPATGRAAEVYPGGKPISLIAPARPDDPTSEIALLLASRLEGLWGSPVLVVHMPGQGGDVGSSFVAKAAADGSLILVVTSALARNPFLRKLDYNPRQDLIPLSLVAVIPTLLVARPSLPVNSVAEFITYAKNNPRKITYVRYGIGSTSHLAGELFNRRTGTELVGKTVISSLAIEGVSTDVGFESIGRALDLVRSGKLKCLGIASSGNSPLAPDLPLVSKVVPEFEVYDWMGIAMKSNTPKYILSKVETDIRSILGDISMRERITQMRAEPRGSSALEFKTFLDQESQKWGQLIRELKIGQ